MKGTLFYLLLLLNTYTLLGQSIKEQVLTNNPAQDRYASYSPNGQQILFESNRNGNWEIYLMDADGVNPQRLTHHDSLDRRPSWHPNGRKIVFESNRDGQHALYQLRLKNRKIKKINISKIGQPMFARFDLTGKELVLTNRKTDTTTSILIINKKSPIMTSHQGIVLVNKKSPVMASHRGMN